MKTALLGFMQTALPAVQTSWGPPSLDTLAKEAAYMGDTVFQSEEIAALRASPHQQDEHYTVHIHCNVLAEGNDVQTGESRMWVIAGAIETAVRNDSTLGALAWSGGGLHYARVNGKDALNFETDQGWISHCVLHILVHARI